MKSHHDVFGITFRIVKGTLRVRKSLKTKDIDDATKVLDPIILPTSP